MLSERHHGQRRRDRDHHAHPASLPRQAPTAAVPPAPTALAATPSPSDPAAQDHATATATTTATPHATTNGSASSGGGGGLIAPIPTSSIRRIVAGQAITDLPSAVKELVDNALDASAKTINVRLFGQSPGIPPGADLIEVSDDGVGVPPESRPYLATRHATSKLTSFEQLYGGDGGRAAGGGGGDGHRRRLGGQLGFRGEALNSLATVSSYLVIATRTSAEPLGQKLSFDRDGSLEVSKVESVSRKVGTTVAVMRLFDALPVRRADFLKRIRTQRAKMLRLLQAYAIFNVGVRFNLTDISTTTGTEGGGSGKYRSESRLVTSANSRRLEDTITGVLGSKFLSGLVRLPIVDLSHVLDSEDSDSDNDDDCDDDGGGGNGNDTEEECKIEGLVSAAPGGGPNSTASARELQFFCLNGRPVDMPKLSRVINDCWRSSANPTNSNSNSKRPACVIKLTLPKNCFDINLAPDKREVLLTHEEETCDALRHVLSELWGGSSSSGGGGEGGGGGADERAFALNEVEEMTAAAAAAAASSSSSSSSSAAGGGVVGPRRPRDGSAGAIATPDNGPSGGGVGAESSSSSSSSGGGTSLILARMDAFRRTEDGGRSGSGSAVAAAATEGGRRKKVDTVLTGYYRPLKTTGGEKEEGTAASGGGLTDEVDPDPGGDVADGGPAAAHHPRRTTRIDHHLAREASSASLARTMSIYTPSNPLAVGFHGHGGGGGGGHRGVVVVGPSTATATATDGDDNYVSNEQRMLSRIAAAEAAEYGVPTVTPEQQDDDGGEPPPRRVRGRMRRRNACINSLDNVGGYGADERESSSSSAPYPATADVDGTTAVPPDVAPSSTPTTTRDGVTAATAMDDENDQQSSMMTDASPAAAAAVTTTPHDDGVTGEAASLDEDDDAAGAKARTSDMNGVGGSENAAAGPAGDGNSRDGDGLSRQKRQREETATARRRRRPKPRRRPDVSLLTRFALGATPAASAATTPREEDEDDDEESDPGDIDDEDDNENDMEERDGNRVGGTTAAMSSDSTTGGNDRLATCTSSEIVPGASTNSQNRPLPSPTTTAVAPASSSDVTGVDDEQRVGDAPSRAGPQDKAPDRDRGVSDDSVRTGSDATDEGKRKRSLVMSSSASASASASASSSTEEEEKERSQAKVNGHVSQDEAAGDEDEGEREDDEGDERPVAWNAYSGGTGGVLMQYHNARRRTKSQYRFLRGVQSERTSRHRAAGGAGGTAVADDYDVTNSSRSTSPTAAAGAPPPASPAWKGDDAMGIGDSVGLPDDVEDDVTNATTHPPSTSGRKGSRTTTTTTSKRKRKRGEVVTLTKKDFRTMTIVGQFNLGFILATDRGGHLWILDQHACDEKANFERLCATTTIHEQRLLAPLPLELGPAEEICILDHMDVFEKNGFRFTYDPDGPPRHRLALTALPHSGSGGDGRRAVQFGKEDVVALCAMLGGGDDDGDGSSGGQSGGHGGAGYGTGADGSGAFGNNAVRRYAGGTWSQHSKDSSTLNGSSVNGSADDGGGKSPPGGSGGAKAIARLPKAIAMFASRACRHSIMIGTALSHTEMEGVVRRMHDVDQPWNCPHGRPTMRHVTDLMACLLEDEMSSAKHVAGPSLAILSQVEDKENDGEDEEE